MKFGRMVQDRAWVLMAMLFSRACLRFGNATKKGPNRMNVVKLMCGVLQKVGTYPSMLTSLPARPPLATSSKSTYWRLFACSDWDGGSRWVTE